jgi:hypothetical protein
MFCSSFYRRIFSFTHGRISLGPSGTYAHVDAHPGSASVVTVGFGGENPYNDLVSCMEFVLTKTTNSHISYDVILAPSDVIGFQLTHLPVNSSSSPDPFVYPKTLYLDRFLFKNFALTNEKRGIENKMRQEIQELTHQRAALTQFNVSSLKFFIISLP